jgi:hypothetical protein
MFTVSLDDSFCPEGQQAFECKDYTSGGASLLVNISTVLKPGVT